MFTEIERHIEAMFPEQTENLQKLIRIESIADISCPRGRTDRRWSRRWISSRRWRGKKGFA